MTPRIVAVTGATGFLGRRLTEKLAASGITVRRLIRTKSVADSPSGSSFDIVIGDLADPNALRELTSGVDAVIHVAGLIKARSRREFFEVNADGAREMARACKGLRLIHVSSLAAREPHLSDYAASKRAGEKAVLEVGGSAVTVVRPPIIYGPGDSETLILFKSARSRFAYLPAIPRARLAVAYVDDVACAIIDLITNPLAGPIVTIGGDRPSGYSWSEILAGAALATGGQPVVVDIPPCILSLAGRAVELSGSWGRDPPIFTLGKAREALHSNWSVSIEEEGVTAARRYTSLAQGFGRTVEWYVRKGWLPRARENASKVA